MQLNETQSSVISLHTICSPMRQTIFKEGITLIVSYEDLYKKAS